MRGRTRILVALAFVLLFALLPAPDDPTGKPYLAFLQVRAWLLDEHASPLSPWLQDGRLPALQVHLQQSPPIEDPDAARRKAAEYARAAVEWAAARTPPAVVAAQRGELPLRVLVGTAGVRAELPQPGGQPAILEAPFASRWSLLPACLAIVLAVLSQRVLLALLAGGLGGAIAFVATTATSPLGPGQALSQGTWHFAVDTVWARSVCSDFYLRITLFVVFLFMAIGVMTRNGGIHGMVEWLQRRVRGPVSAQLCSYATGLLIFFDDYSNCLIAGTSMRPLCDAARVSREKLAYIVDSTAAPVAGLSVFSTWIVYEVSQYRTPLTWVTKPDGTPYAAHDAFAVFVDTLPYRFYCLFALALVFLVVVLRRDFGPMLRAERRARHLGKPLADGARPMVDADVAAAQPAATTPRRARNALLPLGVLVAGTVGLMLAFGLAAERPAGVQGTADLLRHLLAHSQSDWALLGASAAAFATAVLLSLGQRLLSPTQILGTSLRATRALGLAFGILFLAWSLGHVCTDLGTSFFLTAAARGGMVAEALPLLLFGTAGLIAFATGTSFGTMAILLPNVVVLAHQLGTEGAFLGDPATGGPMLMLLSIGAVLEGAIFGDHCSPISDTTVLSSLGSQCDLLGHVQTQMPYALLAFAAAMLAGYLPMVVLGPGWWWLSIGGGLAAMVAWLLLFGRNPDRPGP